MKIKIPIVGALIASCAGFIMMFMGPGSPVSLPPASFIPQVTQSNGVAVTQVPIELPTGFGPQLALSYSAGAGNGVVGLGWQLVGLDAIVRGLDGTSPYTTADRFYGPDGLLVADGAGFRGRDNPNHSFYQKVGPAQNPTAITATSPGGSVATYGQTADATVSSIGGPGAYAWALSKVTDVHGNEYTISYLVDQGAFYPQTIDYESAGGTSQQVQFTYEARPDARQSMAWIGTVTTAQRLSEVTVSSGGSQYRRYVLAYDVSLHRQSSRLLTVTARNAADQVIHSQQFTYHDAIPGMAAPYTAYNHAGTFPPGTTSYVDVNGDGRSDIVHQNSQNTFFVGLSNGSGFGGVQVWAQHGAGDYHSSAPQYADVNGDGLTDLIYQSAANDFWVSLSTGSGFGTPYMRIDHGGGRVPGQAQYADVNGDGMADLILQGTDNQFWVSLATGNGHFSGPHHWMTHGGSFVAGKARYADLNGDGKADLIYHESSNQFWVSLSTGSGFGTPTPWLGHGDSYAAGKGQFADVNGDGLTDLVYCSDNNDFYVSISKGNGFHGPVLWLDHGGTYNSGQAEYADVNGDGMADLVFHGTDNRFWFSLSTGTSFGAAQNWVSHGEAFDVSRSRLADVNGDGRPELLWHGNNVVTLSPGVGADAGLLSILQNGAGGRVTNLVYGLAIDQPGLIQPGSNQPGRIALAPASYVLLQTGTLSGGTDEKRQRFSYSNALFNLSTDPEERRHLGFETVKTRGDVWDGSWIERPQYSIATYDQNSLGSSLILNETRLLNGTLLASTANTYATLAPAYPNTSQIRVLTQSASDANDVSGVLQSQTRQTMSNFDVYGYPRTIVNEGDLASTSDDIRTEITYDSCSPGLNGTVELYDAASAMIDRTETLYNGNCKPTQTTKGFGGVTTLTTIAYDGSGRQASITSNGLSKSFAYSGETVTLTMADGRTTSTTRDPATGKVLTSTNPTGVRSVMEYDSSDRLTQKCVGLTGLCATNPIKQQYNYSGLVPHTGGNVVISDDIGRSRTVTLDARGKTTQTVVVDDRGTITTANTFDSFNRITQVTIDDGSGAYTAKSTSFDSYGRATSVQVPGPNGTVVNNPDLTPVVVTVAGQTGFEKAITNANGQTIYEVRDLKGRLLQRDFQTEDNGVVQWGRTRRHLDARGLPTKIERGYGTTRTGVSFDSKYEHTFTYDALGRKKTQTENAKGTISYNYNGFGKVSQKILGDGTNIFYDYDSLGRRSALRTDTATIATYTYYASGPNQGRLETVVDDTGARTLSYDSYGRVSHIARDLGGGDLYDMDLVYDARGRLTSKKVVGTNMELQYEYFNTGALKKITLQDPDARAIAAGSMTLVTFSNLNQHNKPEQAAYGNGVDLDWSYQKETGLLTQMQAEAGSLADLSYTYRDDALLATITDANDANYNESFAYDLAHRLKTATGPYGTAASPVTIVNYSYAADGQMTSNGETGATQNFNSTNPHRLANTTGGVSYSYNSRGLVSQKVTGGSTIGFTYDHLNRPANITVNDGTKTSATDITYDDKGNRFLKDFTGDGQNIKTYYLDNDYQIRIKDTDELHTLIVRKPDGLLATFSFMHTQFTAYSGVDSIYLSRAAAVAGIGTTAWLKRGQNLSKFFQHWKGTPFVMGLVALLAVLLILFGVLRMDYSGLRRKAGDIREGMDEFLGRPVRVTAWITTQLFLVQIVMLPALNCVDNLDFAPVTSGDLVGNHFFVGNHLRSAYIVTDETGVARAKYAYKPYGRLNTELTNSDVDGDGVHFETTEKYTGQEYDFETGLYNYKARMYDTETGRFLQTDPVHMDRAGYNNYDRYSYVHGNPINMTDPSGKFGWMGWAAMGIAQNGGSLQKAARALEGNIRDNIQVIELALNVRRQQLTSSLSSSRMVGRVAAGAAAGFAVGGPLGAGIGALAGVYANYQEFSEVRKQMNAMNQIGAATAFVKAGMTGMTAGEIILMGYLGASAGGTSKPTLNGKTWAGHNWTGVSNQSDFSKFNNKWASYEATVNFLISVALFNEKNKGREISLSKAMGFLGLIPYLQPEARSFADGLARKHDGTVVGSQNEFKGITHNIRMMSGNQNYYGGWAEGWVSGAAWEQPLDSLGAGIGAAAYAYENSLRARYAMFQQVQAAGARNEGAIKGSLSEFEWSF